MCSSRDCVSAGFTPAIGSSSMISSGSTISARAISSSLRWPPDSEPANSSRMWSSLNRASSSSARASHLGLLRRPQRPEQARRRTARRAGPVAPSFMFSITDSRVERLGELERAHHAHAGRRVWAGTPARSLAVEASSVPASGWSKPVSRLKNVVLPAPFGPDQRGDRAPLDLEVVDVDGDEAAEAARARRRRRGSGRAWPRRARRRRRRGTRGEPCSGSAPDIDRQLPLVAEDALRSEDHQQHQPDADEDLAHDADLVGHEER